MVSKDEWREIRQRLNRFIPVTLQADDYKLTIRLESCGDTRFFFAVYVNDEIKPEWTAISWEISEKFYNRHKHVNLTPKQKRFVKRHSSEGEDLIERMTEKTYTPYWRSFDRLKNHLERKCESLNYIGSDNDEIIAEIPAEEFFSDDFSAEAADGSENKSAIITEKISDDFGKEESELHKGIAINRTDSRTLLEKIQSDDREWITPGEAAEIMGMSSRTFRRHRDEFPFRVVKIGSRYHVNKKAFLEFLRTGDVNKFWRNN